jgi:hypothetical protein
MAEKGRSPAKNDGAKWCAPDCPHASFPEKDHLGGACHTFIALYCGKHGRLVQKSALCLDLTDGPDAGKD